MSPELRDSVVFAARCLRIHGDPCSISKARELDVQVLANVNDEQMLNCARTMLQSLPQHGTRYYAVREIIRVIRRAEVLKDIPEEDRDALRTIMVEQDLTLKDARKRLAQDKKSAASINKGWTG
jgi:hypothetical protein